MSLIKNIDTDLAILADRLALMPLFRGFSRADLDGLLKDASIQIVDENQPIRDLTGATPAIYVFLEGHVRVSTARTGGTGTVVDIQGPGTILGIDALFADHPEPIMAETLTPARIAVIPVGPFRTYLVQHFEVSLNLLGWYSGRLRQQISQVGQLKLQTTAQRVGTYLLGLTDVLTGSALVRLPLEKRHLAQKLAMKPETLSRSLARLKELGVNASADGNGLIIDDIDTLRNFCAWDQ